MKLAVTAANGKLSSAIIEELAKEVGDESVIGIARTPSKASLSKGIEIRKGDYSSQTDFEVALTGIDCVLLVSGMDEPSKRIEQHRNVIRAAKNCGVKKIVYTSVVGDATKTSFGGVILSNRQTEEDIKNSGLTWSIGRNGLYIEPDLEYIETYAKEGKITNSAADGKCAYTSRSELAYAYVKMLLEEKHNGAIYNLAYLPITQTELADEINKAYDLALFHENIDVQTYTAERKAALGDFIGAVIAGIYEGIKNGAFDIDSDFMKVSGRPHKNIAEMIADFKAGSQ